MTDRTASSHPSVAPQTSVSRDVAPPPTTPSSASPPALQQAAAATPHVVAQDQPDSLATQIQHHGQVSVNTTNPDGSKQPVKVVVEQQRPALADLPSDAPAACKADAAIYSSGK
ncbi:uncharacterized protein PFL1_00827 [Pseudozyma flocculosa PF-1]|uniref:Uncharacterized protein n=1 Tax=Pseudozyma flocculosa TaxID=84751 RepID=A0A5C3F673_9BASI|nr:uncharacterized protein PFL1_00827 [Pseudozyma flocculosa PF-1]EPQ31492.1 hypothetical protein PFL1_00827 [Pseudozyma flocculosa PF-1]SPO38721.1 uncharacterized protein PSFLO_04200 [Pseudozyma flocculosa]